MRARNVAAAGLAAAALAMVATPSALGASRTLTIDGWANRTLAFSGSKLLWTEAATVRVNPAKIAGSPRDAVTFDYYRAETFVARLDRPSRRFRAGRPEAAVSVRTSIAAMRAGILAPAGDGAFIMVPRTARVAPPVIHCCDPDGVETVLESDGRAEAPVTIAATWDAGTASFVQVGPGGRQLLRRVDPSNPGAATTTPTDQPAVPGLVAVSNTGRTWVDPAAPSALQVQPSGAAAPTVVALPGPALRVWSATNVIVVAVRTGARISLLRVDQPALSPVRVWRGKTLPRVAVGGGSVAVAERRRVLAARRGSLKVLTRTKRMIEAVGVDRRRVAWIERGVRRKGGRVGVVHLGDRPMSARLLLGVLLALLLGAGGAGAAPIAALQDDNLVNVRGAELEARLDALAATGTKVTRVDVLWGQVAPTRPRNARNPSDPAYDWSRYDQIVRGLSARGIAIIMDFYWTPPWASANGRRQSAPRPADGARFAGALARRYSGAYPDPAGGVLPEVKRLEVWNEPNLPNFWMPQCRRRGGKVKWVSPRVYAALLAASYREIHAANPGAEVIGGVAGPAGRTPTVCAKDGSGAVGSLDWARWVADEGPPLDAWSLHMYPLGGPLQAFFVPSWKTLPRVIRQVDRLRRGAPIHVTETGYHTSYNRYHRYFVSEAQQALWVDETMTAAARFPRVQAVTWFNFQDNPFWTGGLLRGDGSRKPSYDRFAAVAAANPPPPGWAR